MRKNIMLIIVVFLFGCDPFIDPTEVSVKMGNSSLGNFDQINIQRDGQVWLNISYDGTDTSNICYGNKCELVSLLIFGKQKFLGIEYDSINVFQMLGNLKADRSYMFDSEYKIIGDSLILRYGQTNERDTLYKEKIYYVQ
jgi:hypothetical protein